MAAEDSKGKKRKSAPDSAPAKVKKARKSDKVDAAPKPAKATKAVSAPSEKPSKTRAARKTAADFFSDDETRAEATKDVAKPVKGTTEEKAKKAGKKGKAAVKETVVVEAQTVVEAPKEKVTKPKKGKKTESAPAEEHVTAGAQQETAVKKSKKAKGSKKQAEPVVEMTEVEVAAEEADVEAEEDDQTAALLAGFESDDDDEAKDPEDDDAFDADAPRPNMSKKDQTALEKALKSTKSTEPGVIYVGRVPRGFFEAEMKKYFSQFGRVNRLRLSRNKKTGASKHYAFVEFQSSEVADIVARTMNNYLLFGHILKVGIIPAEQVHPDLFKGAGERFKIDPRNKKAGLQMERGVDRAQWTKRIENETKRRKGRSKALLEEYGYEYDAPAVKGVDSVPKQLENADAQPQIEASAEDIPEQPKPKKGKRAKAITDAPNAGPAPVADKKAKKPTKPAPAIEADVQAEIAADVSSAPTPEKKMKKDKKRKSDAVETITTTTTTTTVVETPAAEPPKTKKAKKAQKVVEEEIVVEGKVTKPNKAKRAKA